jgi:hypothetical protein
MADVYTYESPTILDHPTFLRLCRDFDAGFNTKTYVGHLSLQEIFDAFPEKFTHVTKKSEDYVHLRIEDNIRRAFTNFDRREFTNVDYRKKGGDVEIHFFNSMYRFVVDIRAGKGLYGPVSITRFRDGKHVIHPGQHRIVMKDVYHEPMYFVLTDYSRIHKDKDVQEKYAGILKRPHLIEYDWQFGRWSFRYMNHHKTVNDGNNENDRFRDIIDGFVDNDEHSYHRPEWAKRTYTLTKTEVVINDIVICELHKKRWRIVQP